MVQHLSTHRKEVHRHSTQPPTILQLFSPIWHAAGVDFISNMAPSLDRELTLKLEEDERLSLMMF
jgi:hypothetical protein